MDDNRPTVDSTNTELKVETKTKQKSFWRELVEFAFIALIIVIPVRTYIAQPFVVNGASMDPTFLSGEYLIVDQLTYHFEQPARGSILIFKYPKDPSKYFIKRVIGLPGETVSIVNGVVSIINNDNKEGFELNEPYIKFDKKDDSRITLDDEEYFVMGDNRLGSADSRLWGPMPEEDIVGRPLVRLFPLGKIGWMPGDERALFKN
jgi:signal peptidase I